MKILLAGDSWGVGVYQGQGETYAPTGVGIHTLLTAQGHRVINISKAGANNNEILQRIDNSIILADIVLFLQTDPFREHSHFENNYKILDKGFIETLLTYSTLNEYFDSYYQKIYRQLNSYNKTVICVGSWSQLHPSINEYKNLIPAIPSAVKLIVPKLSNDVYLSDFEWFPQLNDYPGFIEKFPEIKQIALASSQKFELLCNQCGDCHPDLAGYELLVKNIQKYLL